ncbi:MAG: DUF2911 domain-containing protein [Opitutaceae bacterium]|nr:DUF2911 domain-containing protein [Opitutaceae bacterium]
MNKPRFALAIIFAAIVGITIPSFTIAADTNSAPAATPRASAPVTGQPKARLSPHETISTVMVDRRPGNRVTITYGRPYTKNPKTGELRKIWGGLVPWGKADRLGADEATLFITQQTIVMGGATIPPGSYTLYTVPSENGPSKLAISTNIGKWGVPVDETHDLARVDMKKDSLDAPVDQLTLAIENDPARGGVLKIKWENTQFSVPFKAPAPRIDFPAASPTSTLKQRIGLTDIEIVYSRPGVKGRQIFGGLLPYGDVWRTGANSATKVVFSTPVKLNGTEIPAGTYGLFAVPGQEEWTVIINRIANQWGAYQYQQKDDVLRIKVAPVKLDQTVETFTIDLNDLRDESATLNLLWEKTRVPVRLEVEVTAKIVAQIEAAMAGADKKPYAQAAMFYLDHNLDLKKAAGWMEGAIAERPDAFFLFYHQARILAKTGDKAAAIAAARHSLELAAKDASPAKAEYTRLNEALIASLR